MLSNTMSVFRVNYTVIIREQQSRIKRERENFHGRRQDAYIEKKFIADMTGILVELSVSLNKNSL